MNDKLDTDKAGVSESIGATERVIDLFGGIRPMAAKLDMPVTTVQGWKKRGLIPQARHADILAAAARENIALAASELSETDPAGGRLDIAPREDVTTSPLSPVMAKRSNALGWTALTIALFTLIATSIGAAAAWLLYLEPLGGRVAALEARPAYDHAIDALNGRVDKLEARLAQAPNTALAASATAPDGESDRLSALERELSDIKAASAESAQLAKRLADLQIASGGRELLAQSIRDIQSSTAATQGEVERLSAQVATLGGRVDKADAALAERRQQGLRAEAVMLAVGELRAAMRGDAPFAKDVAAVRALAPGDQEMSALLDRIQPYADDGVPTQDDLHADFGRLAPNIVRAAVVGDGDRWWRQALYHIESVISVRRVGDSVQGDTPDAVVARAEEKLDEDDLKGAISALKSLTGHTADLAATWLHEAAHRVTIDETEADLTRLSIDRVANATPPASVEPQVQPQSQP
jgi:hypothetical protein